MTPSDPRPDGTRAATYLLALALALAGAGCAGSNNGDDTRVPTSGDPEADRRAEQRVDDTKSDSKGDSKNDKTLYERLGGQKTIAALVDDMTVRTLADPRVNFERKQVRINWLGKAYTPWNASPENVDRFKQRMVEFLTLAAGGPVEYSGRELQAVHEGMRITNSEFDAMVGDFKTSMDKMGFASREKRELLAIVETTRKQIVEKQ